MVTRPHPGARRNSPSGSKESGYTLAALAVAVTVMSILTAVALPVWSKAIQREKEEELIARGLQYAEAIRVFRARFGRAPVRLQELIEVKPRSIRRLWRDPMMEDGEWGLLLENVETQAIPLPPGSRPPPPGSRGKQPPRDEEGEDNGREDEPDEEGRLPAPRPVIPVSNLFGEESEAGNVVTVGPIAGVVSRSRKESLKLFFDQSQYDQWKFRYDILLTNTGFNTPGGTGAAAMGTRPQWIGRPWRPGIVPPGQMPGQIPQGQGPGGQPVMQPGGAGFGAPGGKPIPGGAAQPGIGQPGGGKPPPGGEEDH